MQAKTRLASAHHPCLCSCATPHHGQAASASTFTFFFADGRYSWMHGAAVYASTYGSLLPTSSAALLEGLSPCLARGAQAHCAWRCCRAAPVYAAGVLAAVAFGLPAPAARSTLAYCVPALFPFCASRGKHAMPIHATPPFTSHILRKNGKGTSSRWLSEKAQTVGVFLLCADVARTLSFGLLSISVIPFFCCCGYTLLRRRCLNSFTFTDAHTTALCCSEQEPGRALCRLLPARGDGRKNRVVFRCEDAGTTALLFLLWPHGGFFCWLNGARCAWASTLCRRERLRRLATLWGDSGALQHMLAAFTVFYTVFVGAYRCISGEQRLLLPLSAPEHGRRAEGARRLLFTAAVKILRLSHGTLGVHTVPRLPNACLLHRCLHLSALLGTVARDCGLFLSRLSPSLPRHACCLLGRAVAGMRLRAGAAAAGWRDAGVDGRRFFSAARKLSLLPACRACRAIRYLGRLHAAEMSGA
jgi:hypothetical protein